MRSHLRHGTHGPFLTALVALAAGGCGTTATPAGDAGASDAPAALNGCTEAMFVDRTAAGAQRVVAFGVNGAFTYAPPCMTVAAGQTVAFQGSFNTHPLAPGTAPDAMTTGSPGNPVARTATGDAATFTFPAAGTYPYFCEYHYAGGMRGVVRVR